MKKNNRRSEDEEVRRAKANIRRGFIVVLVIIALLAVAAYAMFGLFDALSSPWPELGASLIPDMSGIISHRPI